MKDYKYGDIIAGKGLSIIEAFEEAYKKYKKFKAWLMPWKLITLITYIVENDDE